MGIAIIISRCDAGAVVKGFTDRPAETAYGTMKLNWWNANFRLRDGCPLRTSASASRDDGQAERVFSCAYRTNPPGGRVPPFCQRHLSAVRLFD